MQWRRRFLNLVPLPSSALQAPEPLASRGIPQRRGTAQLRDRPFPLAELLQPITGQICE
ncbi:MAG: hypothetical protein ABI818_00645 [Acidobacteriota bacterium]